jgi:acyl carrier protein
VLGSEPVEKSSTTELLIELISEETGRPVAEIEYTTKLEDLSIDSLDFVDLMLSIEKCFKPIPKEKWGELDTVGDIVRALA